MKKITIITLALLLTFSTGNAFAITDDELHEEKQLLEEYRAEESRLEKFYHSIIEELEEAEYGSEEYYIIHEELEYAEKELGEAYHKTDELEQKIINDEQELEKKLNEEDNDYYHEEPEEPSYEEEDDYYHEEPEEPSYEEEDDYYHEENKEPVYEEDNAYHNEENNQINDDVEYILDEKKQLLEEYRKKEERLEELYHALVQELEEVEYGSKEYYLIKEELKYAKEDLGEIYHKTDELESIIINKEQELEEGFHEEEENNSYDNEEKTTNLEDWEYEELILEEDKRYLEEYRAEKERLEELYHALVEELEFVEYGSEKYYLIKEELGEIYQKTDELESIIINKEQEKINEVEIELDDKRKLLEELREDEKWLEKELDSYREMLEEIPFGTDDYYEIYEKLINTEKALGEVYHNADELEFEIHELEEVIGEEYEKNKDVDDNNEELVDEEFLEKIKENLKENMKKLTENNNQTSEIVHELLELGIKGKELAKEINAILNEQKLLVEQSREFADEELKDMMDAIVEEIEEIKEDVETIKEIVDFYEQINELDDAIEFQKEIIKKEKDNIEMYKKIGEIFRKRGDEDVKAFVNGIEPEFDVNPIIEDGRTLVPFRVFAEQLQARVRWDNNTNTVIVIKGDTIIILPVGENVAEVNGEYLELDVPAKIVNGRTLIPLRFLSESLGAHVEYEQTTQIIIVNEYNNNL